MLVQLFRLKLLLILVLTSQFAITQEKDDFQGESYCIVYESIFQILFQEKENYDSIQVFLDDFPLVHIDSATKDGAELLDYFVIERKGKRIKSISANQLTAAFRYGFRGKLKKIEFLALVPISEIHFEGTIFLVKFKWSKDKLVSLETGRRKGCCAPDLRILYY